MTQHSFTKVGMHLDLRIQVMRMDALYRLADTLANRGFNTLLIEWEATFPFSKHPLISNRYSYSAEQIREFIGYCGGLGIDVIPLQQCFGHVEYILQHERYRNLRESNTDLCQLCPCKTQEALAVFEAIFSEVIALHPSEYVHIGGDETYLLGSCPECRKVVEKAGASTLYVDYFKKIAELLVKKGKRPVLWADMLLKHPDKADRMPESCVFMDWNYGWEVDRFGNPENLRSGRFEFWGAPALRSAPDNHSLINWPRHFRNLSDYIPYARESGFRGMIITSWSTSGIYGYRWEDQGTAYEILPMRRVYPLGGVTILLDAFKEAVERSAGSEPFVPEAFVREYAVRHFGLTAAQGDALWQSLQVDDRILAQNFDADAAFEAGSRNIETLTQMRVARNEKDFAHLRLIAELYLLRVTLRKLEKYLNSAAFTAAGVPDVLSQLEAMLEQAERLDRCFIELNGEDFYEDELREDCDYRNNRLKHLYARLKQLDVGQAGEMEHPVVQPALSGG